MSDQHDPLFSLSAHFSSLERPDASGVLTGTRAVGARARLVSLDYASIAQLAEQLVRQSGLQTDAQSTLVLPPWPAHYHFFDGTKRTVNWLLLLDALNFCFWGERGQARWQIIYNGETLNGYWAEAAALRRAAEEGKPVWDARYLSNIDALQLASIFRGISAQTPEIPLFEERLRIAREVGQVLLERFDGQFSQLIERAQQSGVKLAQALAEHFSSFRDVASYNGFEVRFLKRAQICVADLHSTFAGQAWGSFTDLDQLTIFADYKLPQVLRHHGALVYTPELGARVDAQEELTPGCAEEVEIRAATIWACELLRRAAVQLGAHALTAADVDQWLWHLGQDAEHMRPYHRVRTIYY
ncbi:MAG TPA: queuosine salvage family protein [Ktedonobacteraceae bacterium]